MDISNSIDFPSKKCLFFFFRIQEDGIYVSDNLKISLVEFQKLWSNNNYDYNNILQLLLVFICT